MTYVHDVKYVVGYISACQFLGRVTALGIWALVHCSLYRKEMPFVPA